VTVDGVLDWQLDLLDPNTITVTEYHDVHPFQQFIRTQHKAGNGSSACVPLQHSSGFPCHQFLTSSPKTIPNSKLFNSTATLWIPQQLLLGYQLPPQLGYHNWQQLTCSEVYDLWSDCREDSAFGFGCLAITRETGTLRPRACTLPSNVYSTAYMLQYHVCSWNSVIKPPTNAHIIP
jgi:hypothetical protein